MVLRVGSIVVASVLQGFTDVSGLYECLMS